ncbi:MAG: alpha/beta hydrolase [Planctomycetaceae bacterium]|nr:alpha/beta hydrolase [Planctomycetaceae bacterium]
MRKRRFLPLIWTVLIGICTRGAHSRDWDWQVRPTMDPVSAVCLKPCGADFQKPEAAGLSAEEVWFPNRQGHQLRGWYFSAPDAGQTILFCMGNTGNVSLMLPYASILHRGGFDVLLFDYQGFGGSEGVASVMSLVDDTHSAVDYLSQSKGRTPDEIGLFGVSMGTVPAITVAVERKVGAVAAEAVFLPSREIERWKPRFGPMGPVEQFALRTIETLVLPRVDPLRNCPKLQCPLLLLHGVKDRLLPANGTLEVAEVASGPHRVWLMEHTGHAPQSLEVNDREYASQVTSFFHDAFSGEVQSAAVAFDVSPPDDDGQHEVRCRISNIPKPSAFVNVSGPARNSLRTLSISGSDDAETQSSRRAETAVLNSVGDLTANSQSAPMEICFCDRNGHYHVERFLLSEGDEVQAILNFRPTDVCAVRCFHAVPTDAAHWRPDLSEYSHALGDLRDYLGSVFSSERLVRLLTEDRGFNFASHYWQTRLPVLRDVHLTELESRLSNLDAVPERLRPRWARMVARIRCWPDNRCEVTQSRRDDFCSRFLPMCCPDMTSDYYELGDAKIELGFADCIVGDALFRMAVSQLQTNQPEAAQELLRRHVDVLPKNVPSNLTEQRIATIRTLSDLIDGEPDRSP